MDGNIQWDVVDFEYVKNLTNPQKLCQIVDGLATESFPDLLKAAQMRLYELDPHK